MKKVEGYEQSLRQQEQKQQEREELNERKTAQQQLKWNKNDRRNTISLLWTPRMMVREEIHTDIDTHTVDEAYSLVHTQIVSYTAHRRMLMCSLYNCVCLPIIKDSFKTLMQQHLDIQHSKSSLPCCSAKYLTTQVERSS